VIIKLQLSALGRYIDKSGQPLAVALGMLVRAYQYAQDTRIDRWEFAIPISEFRYAGVTISELRWLLFSGLAIHAREAVQANGQCRKFTRLGIRSFPPDACFILSDHGVKSLGAASPPLRKLSTIQPGKLPSNGIRQDGSGLKFTAGADSLPLWDPRRLELTFQGMLVKTYNSLPSNQGSILAAFQEELWTHRIDDPLRPEPGQDPRQRLRSAIKQLNRHQENPLLRFSGDGSGRGVVWQSLVQTAK
jgi:hypothetical protein